MINLTAQVPLEQRQIVDQNSIWIFVDKPFYATGQRIQGRLQVNLKETTRVKVLSVLFQGIERTHFRAGKHESINTENLIFGKAWGLASDATIPAGSTTYPFYFDIPVDILPSYTGNNAFVEWKVSSNAEIGWRHDLSQEVLLRVVNTVATASSPVAVENSEAQPRIRIALSSNFYQPGETLEGKMTLLDGEKMKEKGVSLVLVRSEHASDNGKGIGQFKDKAMTEILAGDGLQYSRDTLMTAKEIPFQIQLPPQAACSYTGVMSSVNWSLSVTIDTGFLRHINIRVPFTVGYNTQPKQ